MLSSDWRKGTVTFRLIANYLHNFRKAWTDIQGLKGCETAHLHPWLTEGDLELS